MNVINRYLERLKDPEYIIRNAVAEATKDLVTKPINSNTLRMMIDNIHNALTADENVHSFTIDSDYNNLEIAMTINPMHYMKSVTASISIK
jgi:hypothetical protein